MNTTSSQVVRVALTMGMFGTEMSPNRAAFGIACGQMRPTEHDCDICGLNRQWAKRVSGPVQEYYVRGHKEWNSPRAWCVCEGVKRPQCQKMTHNSGWYNDKGEKVGWGDLCTCDMARIARECGETFYILSESASYWDFQRAQKNGEVGPDATISNPGIEYVRKHAMYTIKPESI